MKGWRASLERIRRMLIKEFIQINRDRRIKGMILVMPVVQVLVFGYAVSTDVRQIRTVVFDSDRTPESRDLVSRFQDSTYFDVVAHARDWPDAAARIDRGDARAILHVDPGFGSAIRSGRSGVLQIIVDGTNSNTAGLVLNYASKISAAFSEKVLVHRLAGAGRSIDPTPVELASRSWFNSNLDSRNFYVPGVVALLVTLITLMLTSMAVVRETEIGTIEQIIVTPIRQSEFILGKTLPFALIAFIDVFLVASIAVFWFEVPIRGSLLLLLGATAIFLMSTIGVGLFISTASRTQQQAMMSAFFFFFPAVLLSGFMFPIANMPKAIQWLTYANPLRYYLVIIRGIFLKGVGPAVLWPQMAALATLGTFALGLAMRRFKKTLS
jgi:ABC-2 type transport system permease protein